MQVTLLENVRFYKEETKNDPGFAEKMAANADVFVLDAFGTAHRAHASTEGVTKYLSPNVAGFLLQKELDYLDGAVAEPKRPFAAIVGGSKVSTKITVIESLLDTADVVILGGGMIFTFYKARGIDVGASMVEEDQLQLAKKLESMAADKGVKLILPTDVIAADKFAADAEAKNVPIDQIPSGWMGLDIGDDSAKMICEEARACPPVRLRVRLRRRGLRTSYADCSARVHRVLSMLQLMGTRSVRALAAGNAPTLTRHADAAGQV